MVERGGLENRCTLTGTVGSNPTLSARLSLISYIFRIVNRIVFEWSHHTTHQLVIHRCCQTNANESQFTRAGRVSGGAKLTPLGKGGGSVELEDVPAGEVAFLVEVVVDGGVDSSEDLKTPHPPEPEH